MNNSEPRLLFINHAMSTRGYHLSMSRAMNSNVVNDTIYYRSHIPNTPTFGSLSI
ncbi:hypothetical protein F383_01878 [Gossypium arboreum]|uniref:Uncharacterized protein n=1 Tax=Gossypium arboreum TaxID=29729 RepID=A0A0B0P3S9_GOSAR|nr:hypothetical protein F383_01878 [Gossypium arboreum]